MRKMTETQTFPYPARRTDDVVHPALGQLEQHWQELHSSSSVPKRSDIDPSEIDAALPWAFVLHRVAPGVARLRVAGQKLHEILRMDPRGMPLSAFFAVDDRSTLAVHLEAVFSEPALVQLPLHRPAAFLRPAVTGALLIMPLADEHGEVTRAFGALVTDRPMSQRSRLQLDDSQPMRQEPIKLFTAPQVSQMQRPNVIRPALRLVVNNG